MKNYGLDAVVLPETPDGELVELGVVAEQSQIFMNRLRGEHAVKGIFVAAGQAAGAEGVFWKDGQQRVSGGGDDREKVFCQFLRLREFTKTVFGCNFPSRYGRDEEFLSW